MPGPPPVRLRRARTSDVGAIARIYNEAVLTTTGTFDLRPRSLPDRRRWFASHDRRHPIFVAVHGRSVVGWASISRWSDRPAYDATAEVSIYVSAPDRGRGIGARLLHRLVRAGRESGLHTLLARVADGNAVSLRMHAEAGFVPVGVMREVGVKFGRRLDVHLLQLLYPSGAPVARPRRARGGRRPGRD
ncbi:MAG TPA: GNAT family N-acetyltransferase [Thermoplasmata archaeon]|nr:GNAT family N-acetyltransferase [Thermoplasmata archaeon]